MKIIVKANFPYETISFDNKNGVYEISFTFENGKRAELFFKPAIIYKSLLVEIGQNITGDIYFNPSLNSISYD